ncbi:MAG: nucleotidyl transferase AbiEii/AbiGii toxin family protein [Planctomycetes bacterium]|nr:nucleotidyl transferase AbiEii/AbiGii toxin family protein [Planctomycetota bacterium]
MLGDGALTFQEFAMNEPLPLATIHDAVLEFLRGRDDAVLFGAYAVNAYVKEPRMTQDVDIASTRAEALAEELRAHLNERFHIAVQVRTVREGIGYRIYQVRKPENRHLVDLRPVETLPPSQHVEDVMVVTPPELIANKVMSMVSRQHKAKGIIDRADAYRVLLAFPALKSLEGSVAERLRAAGATEKVLDAWKELVATQILPEDEDGEFAPNDDENE